MQSAQKSAVPTAPEQSLATYQALPVFCCYPSGNLSINNNSARTRTFLHFSTVARKTENHNHPTLVKVFALSRKTSKNLHVVFFLLSCVSAKISTCTNMQQKSALLLTLHLQLAEKYLSRCKLLMLFHCAKKTCTVYSVVLTFTQYPTQCFYYPIFAVKTCNLLSHPITTRTILDLSHSRLCKLYQSKNIFVDLVSIYDSFFLSQNSIYLRDDVAMFLAIQTARLMIRKK